jgi:hypothetical protein
VRLYFDYRRLVKKLESVLIDLWLGEGRRSIITRSRRRGTLKDIACDRGLERRGGCAGLAHRGADEVTQNTGSVRVE